MPLYEGEVKAERTDNGLVKFIVGGNSVVLDPSLLHSIAGMNDQIRPGRVVHIDHGRTNRRGESYDELYVKGPDDETPPEVRVKFTDPEGNHVVNIWEDLDEIVEDFEISPVDLSDHTSFTTIEATYYPREDEIEFGLRNHENVVRLGFDEARQLAALWQFANEENLDDVGFTDSDISIADGGTTIYIDGSMLFYWRGKYLNDVLDAAEEHRING